MPNTDQAAVPFEFFNEVTERFIGHRRDPNDSALFGNAGERGSSGLGDAAAECSRFNIAP
jgi:hypothetical protein